MINLYSSKETKLLHCLNDTSLKGQRQIDIATDESQVWISTFFKIVFIFIES